MKFILIFVLSMLFSIVSSSQLIGWSFDQVVRLKGSNYKLEKTKTDDGEDIYFVKYEFKTYLNGREMILMDIRETYAFKNSNNKVYSVFFLGAKKESELIEIIEKNNRFKIIDKGKKQEDFEWLDEANNIIYILSIMNDVGNGYKRVSYLQWLQ